MYLMVQVLTFFTTLLLFGFHNLQLIYKVVGQIHLDRIIGVWILLELTLKTVDA